jgi:hypothetical protein
MLVWPYFGGCVSRVGQPVEWDINVKLLIDGSEATLFLSLLAHVQLAAQILLRWPLVGLCFCSHLNKRYDALLVVLSIFSWVWEFIKGYIQPSRDICCRSTSIAS